VSYGYFPEEADSPADAVLQFTNKANKGEIDFCDMEVEESVIVGVEEMNF
jgi:hypothetical protein